MAIILNPEFIVPVVIITDPETLEQTEHQPEHNTYYSVTMDEEIQSVYIVIDQVYINKLNKEARIQADFYKSKASRLKGIGKLETINYFIGDMNLFLDELNVYQSAYSIVTGKLNEANIDKFIAD